MTTTRHTSIYTIRLDSPEAVTGVADSLREHSIEVQDQGDSSVSFRSIGDLDALAAVLAFTDTTTGWTLTTGLGVHRREVYPREAASG